MNNFSRDQYLCLQFSENVRLISLKISCELHFLIPIRTAATEYFVATIYIYMRLVASPRIIGYPIDPNHSQNFPIDTPEWHTSTSQCYLWGPSRHYKPSLVEKNFTVRIPEWYAMLSKESHNGEMAKMGQGWISVNFSLDLPYLSKYCCKQI